MGGALLTIIVEWLRGWLERKQRRQDRRDASQEQTLHELREALYDLIHALSIAKLEYENFRSGKPPIQWPASDDQKARGARARGRIVLLTARVRDKELKVIVRSYLETHKKISAVETGDDAQIDAQVFKALDKLWEYQEEANERIGTLLLKL